MASPEEVAATPAAAYSSTDGGEFQYAAATRTKTMTSFTKRKRTKRRLRSLISSPPRPAPAPDEEVEEEYFSTTTTTTTTTTEEKEEEDMAHCLILLAQSRTAAASSSPSPVADPGLQSTGDTITRRFGGTTTASATGAGALYVYECKTCNKCFPSFQALGGHRASHKKPKLLQQPVPLKLDDVDSTMNSSSSFARVKPALSTAPPPPPAAIAPPANKLTRVHECSICASEFASGQALGGHMRRHRPVLGGATATAAAPDSPELAPNRSRSSSSGGKKDEKKCMLLSLDLNLPAPSEEINGANSMADRPLALVDCHY